ncbi:sugar-binding domain-containing protein [Ruegeria sp. 2205SS24-7]|uniref:sugar-binding transcriptional regulator n=1 Tax=Ruegeria discodermiae TaxID=3064389 RepID=UPI0027429246|nr:sugar-binding domain-containing protein [Ruegeria sp. 2205SS24-7]MDP5220972.1 sugar-binding domain-containing protein [Ruegeria sp. 2205SS24-7]
MSLFVLLHLPFSMVEEAMTRQTEDDELLARAAWLHFMGRLTQSEVAARLGISTTRAHRAIAKAQAGGMVHIVVNATSATCLEMENKLAETFELSMCRVAMDLPERGPIPLRSLGAAGGEWLTQVISSKAHNVVGVSHGRTIAAMVEQLGQTASTDTIFVSLLGGLTRSLAANPYDVIHRLAQKTGADAYLLPVPLFTDSAKDRDVMLAQSMLGESFARMHSATLCIVGIGDLTSSIGVAQTNAASLAEDGAVAEILGQFIDKDGHKISTALDGRTMAMNLDDLANREVVAIAGGLGKVAPIRAALKSGLLTGLIIDEETARALVDGLEGENAVAAQ